MKRLKLETYPKTFTLLYVNPSLFSFPSVVDLGNIIDMITLSQDRPLFHTPELNNSIPRDALQLDISSLNVFSRPYYATVLRLSVCRRLSQWTPNISGPRR